MERLDRQLDGGAFACHQPETMPDNDHPDARSARRARPAPSPLARAPTLGMEQRSAHPDFYIRDQSAGLSTTVPHRHAYFQIQINLGGDTVQHIGGAVRPFARGTLAFILPHRLHLIPHPPDGNFALINFTPEFFIPHIECDPLDLEDISLAQAPELAPFRFQEHLDFVMAEDRLARIQALLDAMREFDRSRDLGTGLMLRGCLLQLVGMVCDVHQAELMRLSADKAEQRGRRDALGRVSRYIREQVANPALSLKDAAAAAFLSPNYLTHLLRKETGSTFTELVLERRMRLARTQLINGSRSVAHIAWACGFADEAYFSRRFRKAYGIAPGQFRRQQQASAR
jgi:AraC-like DNA-binding protein